VLLQLEESSNDLKHLHLIAYDRRKLTAPEINYLVYKKELLAIKYALQTWRIYIDNNHTTVIYTDYESLKYLAIMRNPLKRLAR
jgi:RNase H-like domain found in reverse transcriptase